MTDIWINLYRSTICQQQHHHLDPMGKRVVESQIFLLLNRLQTGISWHFNRGYVGANGNKGYRGHATVIHSPHLPPRRLGTSDGSSWFPQTKPDEERKSEVLQPHLRLNLFFNQKPMIVGWKSTWFGGKIVVLHLILAPIHVHLTFIDQEPAFHPFPVVRNPRRSVASWNPMFGSTIPTHRIRCIDVWKKHEETCLVFQTLIAGSSLFGGWFFHGNKKHIYI